MSKSVAEQIIESVFLQLPAGTKTAKGRRETAGHHEPPSVIAVPIGAPIIRQPNRPGDARYTDVGRQLLVREFRIEWWCHGAGDEATGLFGDAESIYIDTLLAVRNVTHHSVEFSDERWLDQEVDGDGFERHGSTVVFLSTIALPVYERRSVNVTLQADPKVVTTTTMNDEEITE